MPPFIVKNILNPPGRRLQKFERDFQAALLAAFARYERQLFRGINPGNAQTLINKIEDPALVKPLQDAIIAELQKIAVDGADFGRQQIERHVLGIKQVDPQLLASVDWELVNTQAAEWASNYGFNLVTGIINTMKRRLQREITNFITNSETINQLRDRLTSLFGPVRAEMIAVTEVTRAYAEGNTTAWRESGAIEQRRWNTSNDELVCPICGPLHNVVVDMGEAFPGGFNNPPAHPRCRCWVTPVINDD